MKAGKIILSVCLIGLLSACASTSVDTRRQDAFSIARQAGLQPFQLRSRSFGLSGFYKTGTDTSNPVVYVEGDGFAWVDRYTISNNPTPRNPLALKLAARDTSSTVFYLARPCQYVDLRNEPKCSNAYWTNARFAQNVIESFDDALNTIKKKTKNEGFHLVGFSGGGAIVTLLAAKRNDIKSIRTVAGNLDHVTLNRQRKVSQLSRSLNPMDIAKNIQDIPQIHYAGSADKIIPQWVANSFARAAGTSSCVSTRVISGATHMAGWERSWGNLHLKVPQC